MINFTKEVYTDFVSGFGTRSIGGAVTSDYRINNIIAYSFYR